MDKGGDGQRDMKWRQGLQQRLEATLGEGRSKLLSPGIDDYLRQEWNDLGEAE